MLNVLCNSTEDAVNITEANESNVQVENGTAPPVQDNQNQDGDSEEKKKKKKRNRNKGKGKTQTNPPSIPITELFPDGKLLNLK